PARRRDALRPRPGFRRLAAHAADLAAVRVLVRGSRAEEACRRPARRLRVLDPDALRRQPLAGNRPGAAVLLHQHPVPQGALRDARRRHCHAARSEGPRHRTHRFRLHGREPVRRHAPGFRGPREQAASRSVRVPDRMQPGHAEVPAMILINLLPHREERRKRRKQAFFAGLGASVAVGAVVAGLWYLVLEQMISTQQDRNSYLTAEIKKLDEQIKDIANLRAEIEALKARQRAVENLQLDRNLPVHLLNELVKQTPEGVYLSSIKQDGQTVLVGGVAQTNERVSEFL